MPYLSLSVDKFKLVAARELFVNPGDFNYILARLCRMNGLHREFFWQCLQAIEKYFKAGLLVNNFPVKKQTHKLMLLLDQHKKLYGELAVADPVKPEKMSGDYWRSVRLMDFIDRIEYFGDPAARYGLRSYENDRLDLFLLDDVAFELRRRVGRLGAVIGVDFYVDPKRDGSDPTLDACKGKTFAELLTLHPKFQLISRKDPQATVDVAGPNFIDSLYRWNFHWSRDESDLKGEQPRTITAQYGGFGNSFLDMLIESIANWKGGASVIRERVSWLDEHVRLASDQRGALQKYL